MEAVDGFEPKEEVSDPLWRLYYAAEKNGGGSSMGQITEEQEKKVTPLFKD
jgi:hypothetical protein